MQRSQYFDTQYVFSDDLNNTELSKASEIISRTQDSLGNSGGINSGSLSFGNPIVKGGVYGFAADYLNPSGSLYVAAISNSQIMIMSGSALDTNGNRIQIPSNSVINTGDNGINYAWSVLGAGTYYVKLRYMETSGSAEVDDFGVTQYTRYSGSYYVAIDQTAVTSSDIYLATFTGDTNSNISSGSLSDRRQYIRIHTTADAVSLDPTIISYSFERTVQDHVASIGSGTPSTNNPHGLTLADLGYIAESVQSHREDSHVPGIIPLDMSAAAYQTYSASISAPSVNVTFSWVNPTNSYVIVGGAAYSGSLGVLAGISAPGISGSVTGTYYAVISVTGSIFQSQWVSTSSLPNIETTPFVYPSYYVLGKASLTNYGYNLGSWTDLRRFLTMSPDIIRSEFTESQQNPIGVNLSISGSLKDNLDRIRYMIGMAVVGTGSSWNVTPPLTLGPSSLGDNYHGHLHSYYNTYVLNYFNSLYITSPTGSFQTAYYRPGTGVDAASLTINNSTFTLYSSIALGQLATLNIGSLQLNGTQLSTPISELNQLNGISTNVTDTNLNTLTAGASSDASSLHTHNNFISSNVANASINQSTNLSPYISFVTPASGSYRISMYLSTTTAGSSGSVQGTADWIDNFGARHNAALTPIVDLTNTSSYGSGTYFIYAAEGTTISASTNVLSSAGSPLYTVSATIERVSV